MISDPVHLGGNEGWDAIVVAAGRGERLGHGRPKAYIPLQGRPLFVYSLRVLLSHPGVENAFLVVTPGAEEREEVARQIELHLPAEERGRIRLVEGGAERQDSVWNALQLLDEAETSPERMLVIHDAARPLLTHGLLARCLHSMVHIKVEPGQAELPGLARSGPWGSGPAAVVPGLPVRDTLKLVFEDRVVLTHARENLYAVQTPQLFRFGPLLHAHRRAREFGMRATDDSALLEWQGIPIHLVAGEIMNWKVTFPDDLQLVTRLLAVQDQSGEEEKP